MRTQTPSSQNRINLRRSVRGEPPPHPARLRKHRHGWTLHLAHPLKASGCTRPLVLLLIALLLLLGIGAVALYIAFGEWLRDTYTISAMLKGRIQTSVSLMLRHISFFVSPIKKNKDRHTDVAESKVKISHSSVFGSTKHETLKRTNDHSEPTETSDDHSASRFYFTEENDRSDQMNSTTEISARETFNEHVITLDYYKPTIEPRRDERLFLG